MAFTDVERQQNLAALKWFVERRRPPEPIRPQLDIGHAVVGQVADLIEIRPDWQDRHSTRRTPVARVRFVRSRNAWQLYRMRRDLKGRSYVPAPSHRSRHAALEIVDADEYCCFFG